MQCTHKHSESRRIGFHLKYYRRPSQRPLCHSGEQAAPCPTPQAMSSPGDGLLLLPPVPGPRPTPASGGRRCCCCCCCVLPALPWRAAETPPPPPPPLPGFRIRNVSASCEAVRKSSRTEGSRRPSSIFRRCRRAGRQAGEQGGEKVLLQAKHAILPPPAPPHPLPLPPTPPHPL